MNGASLATIASAVIAFLGMAIAFASQWFRLGRFIGQMEALEGKVQDIRDNHLSHISATLGKLFELDAKRDDLCRDRGERLGKMEQAISNGDRRLMRLEDA